MALVDEEAHAVWWMLDLTGGGVDSLLIPWTL